MTPTERFARARALLLDCRDDYERARREFRWPEFETFNWARDWFDVFARGNRAPALVLAPDEGPAEATSFAELAERSSRVAAGLASLGVARGDRVLLLLPNVLPLWELTLAAMKLGAVVVPASVQLTRADIEDRLARGGVRHAVTVAAYAPRFDGLALSSRVLVGDAGASAPPAGWAPYERLLNHGAGGAPAAATSPDDPLLLYFTSGTTAKPKLVPHTHRSYPVGHLSTMYWLGLREGDVHQNLSSPGWAKHAWSCLFAPFNAGATVFVHDYARFRAARTLELLRERGVVTFCAPPTVWRMLIVGELGPKPPALRELCSAGEPLNPEVMEQVHRAWGLTVRDGYGQTETTALVGNPPGLPVKPGSMGRPLPGYDVVLLDGAGREADEGEVALRLDPRPAGLTGGYLDDAERSARLFGGAHYPTGDEARRDAEGYFYFVGRGDDVFKSSDYRLSPFELESVLVEHPLVAEAAVVPSPDPLRLSVPKAFLALAPGAEPGPELAREVFAFARERLAPYQRVRRLEFVELPKTISGKIRRVELREREREARARGDRSPNEYWEDDLREPG
ncbi:MAG TPA: AMP-binding protein [Polyangiaceae bacterium]|nr:AMP-binding protein [Polyangiaceae bacterium]